ncbi:hypothetical protein TNCV_4083431 [Trichonephila clavipes]|nr:hypothetical protein TNCV_4083431 [Trichonephila clavipes]
MSQEKERGQIERDKQLIPTAKVSLHLKKILLSVWWDMSGVIYFEILELNQTINSEVYREKLCRLSSELIKNADDWRISRKCCFIMILLDRIRLEERCKILGNLIGNFCHTLLTP